MGNRRSIGLLSLARPCLALATDVCSVGIHTEAHGTTRCGWQRDNQSVFGLGDALGWVHQAHRRFCLAPHADCREHISPKGSTGYATATQGVIAGCAVSDLFDLKEVSEGVALRGLE